MDAPAGTGSCPTPKQLQRLDAGELEPADAAALRAHQEGCPSCMKQRLTSRSGNTTKEVGPHAAVRASAQPLARGATLGRYTVLDKLGEGGMGMVFAAYDAELNRRVALKLLSSASDPESQQRLLREAQAMAKLAHPNVVAIHDVGTFGGTDVAVVMEFVEGGTLRGWREAQPRGWREKLRVLLAAGEGLAAAHAAGLIHRDFKPDNILVGNDGRVRVADFGIARAMDAAVPLIDKDALVTSTLSSAWSSSTAPLTRAGAVVGTPAYMAPEQFTGAPADVLSDQYSFAVTLYEALTGTRPFGGDSIREHLELARAEQYLTTPNATPTWLLRTVKRALSPEPSARFPSMEALLVALRRDPSVLRLRVAAIAAPLLLLAGIVGALFAQRQAQVRACRELPRALQGVWDGSVRAQVEGAFTATRLPFATKVLRIAERALDQHSEDWAAMKVEACQATRLRHEQSESILRLRDHCLDERLDQLRAVSQLLVHANAPVVSRTGQLVDGLAPIRGCADVSSLLARPPLPTAPAQHAELARLSAEVERAQAISNAGDLPGARKLLESLTPAEQQLAYAPLLAHSENIEGELFHRLGRLDLSRDHFSAALTYGLESGDNDAATRAADGIGIGLTAAESYDLKSAREWAGYAMALSKRGVSEHAQAFTWGLLASVEARAGNAVPARAADAYALKLSEQGYGPDALVTLGLAHNSFLHLRQLNGVRAAAAGEEELIPRVVALFGEEHPLATIARGILVEMYAELGNLEAAQRTFEALKKAHGEGPLQKSPFAAMYGDTATSIGEALVTSGRAREALPLLELGRQCYANDDEGGTLSALAAEAQAQLMLGEVTAARALVAQGSVRVSRPGHAPSTSDVDLLAAQAQLAMTEGKAAVARDRLEEALSLLGKLHEGRRLATARLQAKLAEAEVTLHHPALAAAALTPAMETLTQTLGAQAPALAPLLLTEGEIDRELGRPRDAQRSLERAKVLLQPWPGRVDLRTRIDVLLAGHSP